jgi:hypothetical protein
VITCENSTHSCLLQYFVSGLEAGNHNVKLTANPGSTGVTNPAQFVDIDYFQVFSSTPIANNANGAGAPATIAGGPTQAAASASVPTVAQSTNT